MRARGVKRSTAASQRTSGRASSELATSVRGGPSWRVRQSNSRIVTCSKRSRCAIEARKSLSAARWRAGDGGGVLVGGQLMAGVQEGATEGGCGGSRFDMPDGAKDGFGAGGERVGDCGDCRGGELWGGLEGDADADFVGGVFPGGLGAAG